MKSKLYLPISLAIVSIMSCKAQQKTTISTITLSNNSNIELLDKAITIKRAVIDKKYIQNFPLLICNNDTIPSQVNDLDGDGKWDELFVIANFASKE